MTAPLVLKNARLVDPASNYDGPGALVIAEGVIVAVAHRPEPDSIPGSAEVIDVGGAMLAPGLIDLRAKTGEPGAEPKETLKSASRAAGAGGVTTFVIQPDTDPAIDDPAMVDFILRRARDLELVHVLVAGAVTRGCHGGQMAELGLMRDAGAAYFSDGDQIIADTKVFRRALTYAKAFGARVAHRPADPHLTKGTVATAGEFAGRYGLPAAPSLAESIMLERDLMLAEMTGGALLVDQISTRDALERLARAKQKGVDAVATASINHLSFNEYDIGDYRTFYRMEPPLRTEDDRQALIAAVVSGLVPIIVSAHNPAPAEDKRLPFAEAAPGCVGLETLLPALLALYHSGDAPLIDLMRAVTSAPAALLGLESGRLIPGAPADLVVCDLDAPIVIDADKLISKSKNSPFDGRRLQGQVRLTLVDGRIVHRA